MKIFFFLLQINLGNIPPWTGTLNETNDGNGTAPTVCLGKGPVAVYYAPLRMRDDVKPINVKVVNETAPLSSQANHVAPPNIYPPKVNKQIYPYTSLTVFILFLQHSNTTDLPHHRLHSTFHMSHITRHTSHITHHTSCLLKIAKLRPQKFLCRCSAKICFLCRCTSPAQISAEMVSTSARNRCRIN